MSLPLGPLILDNQLNALVSIYVHVLCLLQRHHEVVTILSFVKNERDIEPIEIVQLLLILLSRLFAREKLIPDRFGLSQVIRHIEAIFSERGCLMESVGLDGGV